jgi:hypothetical protein
LVPLQAEKHVVSRAIRPPAVAGLFYPGEPDELRRTVQSCLAAGRQRCAESPSSPPPKALIAPHAGFVYSGPVAGSAYALLEPLRQRIRRVVLLGPSHRVAFRGLALSSADAYRTPLGDVPLDRTAAEALADLPQVRVLDAAHAEEHSLEVQLPFLQETLDTFTLLPIVAGEATPQEVAQVIESVWGGDETLIVVSSDLSHYQDYATARSLDQVTSTAIVALCPEDMDEQSACGRVPVRGLLVAARRRGLAARALDLRSSGDTAGPRDRVVGYGAYAFA